MFLLFPSGRPSHNHVHSDSCWRVPNRASRKSVFHFRFLSVKQANEEQRSVESSRKTYHKLEPSPTYSSLCHHKFHILQCDLFPRVALTDNGTEVPIQLLPGCAPTDDVWPGDAPGETSGSKGEHVFGRHNCLHFFLNYKGKKLWGRVLVMSFQTTTCCGL